MKRLVLIALPVAAAFAQQFEPFDATERQASAKAAQWMQSPGYREKAWGAYLAGKYRLQDHSASLVSQLEALRELAGDTLHVDAPEFGAIQATLDALIQLGHPVDAASLLPFRKQWANEVLILLAEDPQANREALLAMAEQRDPADTRVAERFELFVCGIELANAFVELTDADEQRARFVADRARRHAMYGPDWEMDEAFLNAVAKLPPCAGIALGFDRLAMLATGALRICDVLWLPS